MHNLQDLNKAQREAVQAYEGPVLVLAGAGSGKTRVITHRIAFLLQERLAKPCEILAVTFTNKAASEMRQRVHSMLGQNDPELFIGTFHAFGARFLRRHAEAFGRTARFTIYDEDDQDRLIRTLLKAALSQEDAKRYHAGAKKFIEKVKINLGDPQTVAAAIKGPEGDLFCENYDNYNTALQQNNAFDFDDLVAAPCHLLRSDGKLRTSYRQRFRFLLIDEFQDTNFPQGELARLFAAPSGNITAVGDDDQSIYGWRGAYLGNILQFESDYQGVKTFRLEQNYRSTQVILDAAHRVILNNTSRHAKKLWTSRHGGAKPRVISASDDREEAGLVISRIQEIVAEGKYRPGQIVILYRTNAQSRAFEDVLRQEVIPYVIVGGLKFYERKEVKDFLAYLRLLVNPNDAISLQRVINLPPRGIGQKTLARLNVHAASRQRPLYQALLKAEDIEGIGKGMALKIVQFARWIETLKKYAGRENLFKVGERLLHESGLLAYYKEAEAPKFASREENLSELLNALREYSYASDRSGLEDLEDFLQEVALVTDIDRWDPDEQAITLMTLHSAKGLEFPIVFLTGLEDGLFPLLSVRDEPMDIEEERRLFYVGATRAKDVLYLTYARNRMRWGQEMPWQRPSRFLDEIPRECLEFEEESHLLASADDEETLLPRLRSRSLRVRPPTDRNKYDADLNYALGSRVRHAQFGEGIIVQTEGRGKGLRLLVNFEDVGQKLLLASFARLKILQN
jgi:DNA helicase-2/ATP-dependent DNA helicase PcrA